MKFICYNLNPPRKWQYDSKESGRHEYSDLWEANGKFFKNDNNPEYPISDSEISKREFDALINGINFDDYVPQKAPLFVSQLIDRFVSMDYEDSKDFLFLLNRIRQNKQSVAENQRQYIESVSKLEAIITEG